MGSDIEIRHVFNDTRIDIQKVAHNFQKEIVLTPKRWHIIFPERSRNAGGVRVQL